MEYKKEIEELLALYTHESSLFDIYVEGVNDYNFYSWFFSVANFANINIYSIDDINVSEDILQKFNLSSGNRNRVIALSQEFDSNLNTKCHIFCIADRDFEDYVPIGIQNKFLHFTDYPSLEVYLWNEKTILKFIQLVLGGINIPTDQFFYHLTEILQTVFTLRLTNSSINWNMTWIDFTKYVIIDSKIHFDKEKFIKAYLTKNNKWDKKEVFIEEFNNNKTTLKEDLRLSIRGHDISCLLYHIVGKLKKRRKFLNVETLEGSLLGCIDYIELRGEYLFSKLINI